MNLIKSLNLKSGEKIELFYIAGSGKNPKNILIIGGFHGEEPQGVVAIKHYFFNNKILKSKNNIYILPCLNPDGIKQNKRQNHNGVDLNRNFPTKNWEITDSESEYYGGDKPCSEEETKFLTEAIKIINPTFVLSLHSPYSIVNYDGPATIEAKKISEITKYPIQADIGYPTPGSFGTYTGIERNIPTITLEYDESENINDIILKSSLIFKWLMEEY